MWRSHRERQCSGEKGVTELVDPLWVWEKVFI